MPTANCSGRSSAIRGDGALAPDVLVSPDRHALATISWTMGGRTRTRHYNSLHVVEFDDDVDTADPPALALAVVLYDVLALFRDWED